MAIDVNRWIEKMSHTGRYVTGSPPPPPKIILPRYAFSTEPTRGQFFLGKTEKIAPAYASILPPKVPLLRWAVNLPLLEIHS